MDNAMLIAMVAGPTVIVLGLSMLFYSKAWSKMIAKWSKDHFPLFPVGIMHLVVGLVMLNMYNVWVWDQWILVTLLGWVIFLKGVAFFLLPGDVFKDIAKTFNKNGMISFAGLVHIVVGAVLTYYSYPFFM